MLQQYYFMILFEKKKTYILIILLIYDLNLVYKSFKNKFVLLKIYIYKKLLNKILLEIDISGITSNKGPGNFINGINQVLPFIFEKCCFISSKFINNFLQPDFYFIPFPQFTQNQYLEFIKSKIINKFILGPIFVPNYWFSFPDKKYWVESQFQNIFKLVKGIAVHSKRVKDHLSNRANITEDLNKFIIIRPCTNIKPIKIKSFSEREIDILFFEKYADLNRRKQGSILLNLFKNTSKRIESIKYGFYNKAYLKELANNSKFIIYFSFFDTGAIGLKEIQNFGVICFSHQKEFIIDNETSYYIPELANINNIESAFHKIMKIIDSLSYSNIKTELIAKKNQMINKCENSLVDLCKNLF